MGRGRGGGRGAGRSGPGSGDKGDIAGNIYKIIKMIKEKNLEPVIVFSFSRRRAFACASLTQRLCQASVCLSVSLTRADKPHGEHCQLSPLRFSGPDWDTCEDALHHSSWLKLAWWWASTVQSI